MLCEVAAIRSVMVTEMDSGAPPNRAHARAAPARIRASAAPLIVTNSTSGNPA